MFVWEEVLLWPVYEPDSEVRDGSGSGCRDIEMRLWPFWRTCWERERPRPDEVPVINQVGEEEEDVGVDILTWLEGSVSQLIAE